MAIVIGAILIPIYMNVTPVITEEYYIPIKSVMPWIMLAINAIYFPLCHMSSWQATIGKMLLKLKVVKTTELAKLSPRDIIIRSGPLLLLLISQIDHLLPSTIWDSLKAKIAIYLLWVPIVLTFVMSAFDKEKRTLGDRLASTRVINVR